MKDLVPVALCHRVGASALSRVVVVGAVDLAPLLGAVALSRFAARLVLRPPVCKMRGRVDLNTTNGLTHLRCFVSLRGRS